MLFSNFKAHIHTLKRCIKNKPPETERYKLNELNFCEFS